MWRRRQPYVVEAATLCGGGCNPMWRRGRSGGRRPSCGGSYVLTYFPRSYSPTQLLSYSATYLLTYLPTYELTNLATCQLPNLPTFSLANLPTYLLTS